MSDDDRTPERRRLDAWSSENPRDELAIVALAAWLNTTPDKLPSGMRAHTCQATKEAWARVAAAIAAIPATDAREAALHRATELKVVRAVDVCNRVLHFDLARMIDFDSDDYNQAVKDAADAAREAYAAILALISANSRTT